MTPAIFTRSAAAGIAMTAGALAPAMAQEMPVAKIMVSGTGIANVAPDMAVLSLTVVREAASAREALSANNAAMAEVLSQMKARAIAERDLQTANFTISPRYKRYTSNQNNAVSPEIIGYVVQNSLSVRVRDLSQLGEIIDASVSLGVNSGGNIAFTNDDPSAAIDEARALAMQKAIASATTLTNAAGIGLGPIMEISEQSFQPRPMPMARAEMAMASDSAVPIASGENSYSVTVNVTFALDQ